MNDLALGDLAGRLADEIAERLRVHNTPWRTPADAATYLSLSVRGLEDMRARGTGPKFSKINDRIVRYRVADLDAWLLNAGGAHD